ncbi:MAG TPA: SRPBCC family protein [Gemmatimonadaceae bacterium]|nr:SRPBCC family protein [Gemmatimonadaceae bacterium]
MGKANQPNPPRRRKRTTTTTDVSDTTDVLGTPGAADVTDDEPHVARAAPPSASRRAAAATPRLRALEARSEWREDEDLPPLEGVNHESMGPRRRVRRRNGRADGEDLAAGLGWFSLALGIAQIAAPGGMARMIGVRNTGRSRAIMRAIGVRELAAGVGLLSQARTSDWALARAAGDVMDLTLLGSALGNEGGRRRRTAAATAAVLGVAALDLFAGKQLGREEATTGRRARPRGIRVQRSITVNRSPEEVYAFWRDFENLPRFMRHLESVRDLGDGRSRWKARAPAGATVVWEAELVDDRPNELIAWRSVEGSDVWNTGAVRFRPAPGGRGTEVHVNIRYYPPGGVITSRLAMLFREEPGQQVQDDLRHFKQVMETGEIVLSDATVERGSHPAQPTEERDVNEEVDS